jgi:hypothetical protein
MGLEIWLEVVQSNKPSITLHALDPSFVNALILSHGSDTPTNPRRVVHGKSDSGPKGLGNPNSYAPNASTDSTGSKLIV